MKCLSNDEQDLMFERVYQIYRPYVYRCLLRCGCAVEEAEDLTQDVFLKVYLHRDRLQCITCLRKWLLVIARNTYISTLRKKCLQTVNLTELGYCCCVYGNTVGSDVAVWEQMELIWQTFPPESTERSMVGWLLEGLSCDEMAVRLGISNQAVRSRLCRMRKKLSKTIYPVVS